jgi:hypothetical protein
MWGLEQVVDYNSSPDIGQVLGRRERRTARSDQSAQAIRSRTLAVSVCCWKSVSLPSATFQTCTIFTSAGWPDALWSHE